MKKILYLILLLPFFSLQSCVEDEKDIFDASAAERIAAAMKEYRATLAAAENGWLLAYYPEKNHSIGGYNMMAKFTAEGNVTLSSEVATRNYEAGDTLTSQYDIISDMGPVLTFNTYNEILHHFTEPNGSSDVDGMAGDYEFVFMEVTPSKIILKGKKYDNKLVMTRLEEPTDPKAYYTSIAAMEESASFGNYYFRVNGDSVSMAVLSDRVLNITYEQFDESGDVVVQKEGLAFTFTPTGIKLYEPFVYTKDLRSNSQVKMENFDWNDEAVTFTCTDAGVDAEFEAYLPEGYRFYRDFIGTYTMKYSGNKTTEITISEKVNKKSFTAAGGTLDYPFEFGFDLENGTITLGVQKFLADLGSNQYMGIAMWDSNKGYVNFVNAGLIGVCTEEGGHLTINFKDNKLWPGYTVDGFIYWKFDGSGTSIGSGGGRFYEITLTKK